MTGITRILLVYPIGTSRSALAPAHSQQPHDHFAQPGMAELGRIVREIMVSPAGKIGTVRWPVEFQRSALAVRTLKPESLPSEGLGRAGDMNSGKNGPYSRRGLRDHFYQALLSVEPKEDGKPVAPPQPASLFVDLNEPPNMEDPTLLHCVLREGGLR